MKIGFIGTGNMASAMIAGYLKQEQPDKNKKAERKATDVFVSDTDQAKTDELRRRFGVSICKTNKETVKKSDIIVIAVKPHVYGTVMKEIKTGVGDKKIIVSIAAGISIEKMEKELGKKCKIVRTMPNTPCMVGEGMTAVTPNANISEEDLTMVLGLLNGAAKTEVVPENLMDAVVAASGSAPAYVYMFIEAMVDGVVACGMPRAQAYRFAAQAVLGSAKMVLETGRHPGELKDAVCSPGGSTIEAVRALEQNGFRGTVMRAVEAAATKSKKMSEQE